MRSRRATAPAHGAALIGLTLLAGCAATPSPSIWPVAGGPVYTLDRSFPKPSGVSFHAVSGVARDAATGLVYVPPRSVPAVSAWTADALLVSRCHAESGARAGSLSYPLRGAT